MLINQVISHLNIYSHPNDMQEGFGNIENDTFQQVVFTRYPRRAKEFTHKAAGDTQSKVA